MATRLTWGLAAAFVAWLALIVILIFSYRWMSPPATTLTLAQRFIGVPIKQTWRPLSAMSPNLMRAVIMSEDAAFCAHHGVDFAELGRAYERGLGGGMVGGASTISMQLVKNLFLWPSHSYVRKAIEVPVTLVADPWWGKPRTLEMYLNVVEWGPGIFGAEAAAEAFFHKRAAALTETEAALMAVALPNPLKRNPAHPSALQRRLATIVLARMRASDRHVRCLAQAAARDD